MSEKKNHTKGDAYRFAWERIPAAIEDGYPLEAIAICESMITDRLISMAAGKDCLKLKNDRDHVGITRVTKMLLEHDGIHVDGSRLLKEILVWVKDRNTMLHSFAKSLPGHPIKPRSEFLKRGIDIAERGAVLARETLNWHRRELAASIKNGEEQTR